MPTFMIHLYAQSSNTFAATGPLGQPLHDMHIVRQRQGLLTSILLLT